MMRSTLRREAAAVGIRLLDEAYLSWSLAQMQCVNALSAWSQARGGARGAAHLAYCAALDREEAAARDLAQISELARSYG
jgi:hypothetical protein